MTLSPLTEHHLEFLSLTVGCIGSSEFTYVKIPDCWKSPVMSQFLSRQNVFAKFMVEFKLPKCFFLCKV